MPNERLALALRVLGCVNKFTLPKPEDEAQLRGIVPSFLRDAPVDELARAIVDGYLEQFRMRRPMLRQAASAGRKQG